MNEEYFKLFCAHEQAIQICSPIEFDLRQHSLLHAIALYLLERDKPQDKEENWDRMKRVMNGEEK